MRSTTIWSPTGTRGRWASVIRPAFVSDPVSISSTWRKNARAFAAESVRAAASEATTLIPGNISRNIGTAITWSGWACVMTTCLTKSAADAQALHLLKHERSHGADAALEDRAFALALVKIQRDTRLSPASPDAA